jgi:8-oxo-dGTP pyrophosphatase MutT (NUDIX family)
VPGKRLSCGVIPVREDGGEILTLMLRAFQYWDFPKGIIEAGEEPLAAAVRELKEETGIETPAFDWGEQYFETGPYSRGKVARYYIGRTTTAQVIIGPSPDTGQPEHHEWRWVNFDEAFDIASPRVREVVRWARNVVGA